MCRLIEDEAKCSFFIMLREQNDGFLENAFAQ